MTMTESKTQVAKAYAKEWPDTPAIFRSFEKIEINSLIFLFFYLKSTNKK